MSFVSASSPECIDLENEEKEEVSKPLTSLQEILEWEKFVTPFQVESLQMRTEFSVRGSSFHCHSSKSSDWKHLELNTEDVPKTLVCHDMKGGYIEDRYIDGTETPDAYRFFHWAGIDTFVYFSHKLLTIPPPVWITAGHIHGVKVLGTLITEWDEGEIFWNMLLSNEKKRVSCVQKMVEICEKFGFDGYLLNVENKIPENDVPKLVKFVEELQEALHKKLPNSELVWYDSVISNGKLKWQNELNELNKLFFDACDGMLLNYPWREEHLERSAAAAGPARARDVYAGVDVFGRGSFGGGGFGAADALRAARRLGLSAALFAPGWTHEALGGGAHFACNEHLFWARLRPHLHVRGPALLPLRTSFCQGFGRRGRVSWGRAPACPAARPWFHLGRQRLQPSVASCLDGRCTPQPERPPLPDPDAAQPPPPQPQSAPSCGGANRGCVQHFEADAFDGGGCLQVRRAQDEDDDGLSLHRLFVCDLKSQSGRLVVVYAVKGVPCDTPCSERRSAELRLALVLRDSPSAEPRMMWVNDCNGHQVQRTSDGSSWEPFNSKTPQTSWQVWEYSVPVRGHVVEIIAGLPPGCKAALIGWLEITDAGPEEICDTSKNARENQSKCTKINVH